MPAAKQRTKAGFSYASKFVIWGWIIMFAGIFFFAIGMGTDYLVRTYEGEREYSRGLWKFCRAENTAILEYKYEIRCYQLDVTGSKPWQAKYQTIQALEAVAMAIMVSMAVFLIPVYILVPRLKSKPMAGINMALAIISGIMMIAGMALFWIDFIDQGIGTLGYSWVVIVVSGGIVFISAALLVVEFVKFRHHY